MKQWKIFLACATVLALMLSLCACGGNGAPSGETGDNNPNPTVPTDPADEYEYEVELVGAELFSDTDGEDAIRVYYDFTNNSDSTKSALMALTVTATQGGAELVSTYAAFDSEPVAESDYYGMAVRPGVTIRCAEEYKVDPEGGTVTLSVERGWFDENPLSFDLELDALTAPADAFEITAIADPDWTDSYEDRGTVDDSYEVFIDNAEVVTGWEDSEILRVYIDFTNNSDEAASFYMATAAFAYQDGVQLAADYAADAVEEDENYSVEVAPGETIRVTRCFGLRSGSEVEVEIADSMGTTVAATSYTLE